MNSLERQIEIKKLKILKDNLIKEMNNDIKEKNRVDVKQKVLVLKKIDK